MENFDLGREGEHSVAMSVRRRWNCWSGAAETSFRTHGDGGGRFVGMVTVALDGPKGKRSLWPRHRIKEAVVPGETGVTSY